MVSLEGYSIGRIVTPVGWDGSVFRPLLLDNLGRPLLVAGHDGVNYHVLKTDSAGQLEVKVSGTVPDADTVDTLHANAFVLKAGDTMTGDLVLPADPTLDLQAATKKYVDNKVGAQGTLIKTVWSADAPPVTAGSLDDEFDDNSFDTVNWTEFDVPGLLTITEDDLGAKLTQITAGGENNVGAFKLVPNADWTIWTRVAFVGNALNYGCAGLLIGKDLAGDPANSELIAHLLVVSSTTISCSVSYYTKWNTLNTTWAGWAAKHPVTHIYLRVRRLGGTLCFDFSTDGQGWVQLHLHAEPWPPKNVGILTNNVNTGVSIAARFQFFRYLAYGLNTLTNTSGRRIKMFA